MLGTQRRGLVAALVALLALLVAHWFDAGVLADAQIRAGHTYDDAPFLDLIAVARILTAAGVVAIALAGWRSRSLVVGAGYAVVGGFLVFLPVLFWAFAVSVNGAPTAAPQPVASTLTNWEMTLAPGVTGAVYTLAAAMFLSGLALVVSGLRGGQRGSDAITQAVPPTPSPGSEPA